MSASIDPPRLLFVATVPLTFRAFFLPYARHFRGLGWRVDALAHGATNCESCRAEFDQVHEAPWTRNPLDGRNFLAAGVVRRIVREGRYDLVHVHTPIAAFVTRLALRHSRGGPDRPRVLYTAHGFHFHAAGSPWKNALFHRLEQQAGRWTDRLIVMNADDLAAAQQGRFLPAERIHLHPGVGIDTRLYAPQSVAQPQIDAVRGELGLLPSDQLFTMIAEFNPGKRHADAVAALGRLQRTDVHLALAGVGPLLERVKQQAASLGLTKQVHFLGFRRDVPALLRASLATVLPSEREGLPRSVMESLALATPVLGARIRGTRDLVDESCGRLVDVGDVPGLAAAMRWCADHPAECRAMGERGRARMEPYSLPRVLRLHEELYRECLAEAGRRHISAPHKAAA